MLILHFDQEAIILHCPERVPWPHSATEEAGKQESRKVISEHNGPSYRNQPTYARGDQNHLKIKSLLSGMSAHLVMGPELPVGFDLEGTTSGRALRDPCLGECRPTASGQGCGLSLHCWGSKESGWQR